MAGTVFHDYRKGRRGSWCEMTVAVDDRSVVTRELLRQTFTYPFRQLGVSRLQAVTAKTNRDAQNRLKRLGFHREGTLRRAFDGQTDLLMYSMLPYECWWLDRMV